MGAAVEKKKKPEPGPAPAPSPWIPCESYNTTECEDAADECALCTMPSGEDMCFNPTSASKLPPFIFKCKLPKPDKEIFVELAY